MRQARVDALVGLHNAQRPRARPRYAKPVAATSPPPVLSSSGAVASSALQGIEKNDWPPLMHVFYDLFTVGKEWGREWEECVAKFVAFERGEGFPVSN